MVKKHFLLLVATALAIPTHDENHQVGWLLDDDGKIVMENGNPVWQNSAGEKAQMDHQMIRNLNRESKQHREAKEAALLKLKDFEGIDPTVAREMLEKYKDVDLSKMIDANKLDEVRSEVRRSLGEQHATVVAELQEKLNGATSKLHDMMITNALSTSDFLQNSIADNVPRDMLMTYLRPHFSIVDDRVVAKVNGEVLASKTKMNEDADAHEAIELIINMRPDKDSLLRSDGHRGSGGKQSSGRGGVRRISRANYEALSPADKAKVAKELGAGTMQLV